MAIKIVGEDNRPRFTCPFCKSIVVVDIRPFNKDMSKLAEYTCHSCGGKIYAGLLLIAAPKLDTLLGKLKQIIETSDPKNTIELGKKKTMN